MATDDARFRQQLESLGLTQRLPEQPAFESVADLARMSREAMAEQRYGTARHEPSRGTVRLHGPGVEGHAADLDSVGSVMVGLQRLVTSVGASISGVKTLKGRLSSELTARTALLLSASLAPGSLVLDITPRRPGIEETEPAGQMAEPPIRPLADLAIEVIARLFGIVNAGDAVQDSLEAALTEQGPRVASALKELLTEFDAARFDTDLAWTEPGKETLRTTVSAANAGSASRAIGTRNLDTERLTLIGRMRTLSDFAPTLHLETEIDGDEVVVGVRRGSVDAGVIAAFHTGQWVKMTVIARPKIRPGGEAFTEYEALSIEPLLEAGRPLPDDPHGAY